MIPTGNSTQVQTIGNFDRKAATIELTPQVVALLSADMYEDRLLAIVRELLCNGRDAHKEAGTQDVPMLLQLPNTFEPFLCFRDYGTGLTYQQMFDIYLTYGASTKRGSNDYVGMFGVGSKSPLSYTDNFLVSSFKDGVETQYNIYMNSGIPDIARIFERPTTEKNGLKISIAINQKDFQAIKQKAGYFLKLFDFPVTVTGQEDIDRECNSIFENETYKLIDNYRNGAFALMGGVTYGLSNQVFESLREVVKADTIILPFELGMLNVAGSRESLSFVEGDTTDTRIKERVAKIKAEYYADMNAAFDKCTTLAELTNLATSKYNLSTRWGGYLQLDDKINFKGVSLLDWESFLLDDIQWRIFRKYCQGTKEYNYKGTCDLKLTSVGRQDIRAASSVFFDGNRGKGNVQAARKYAREYNKAVIFDATQEEKEWLISFMGEIPTILCTDVYEELFPKVVRDKSLPKVRKVSGVFQYKNGMYREVKEMKEDETGYYVDMVRNLVHIDGKELPYAKFFTLIDNNVIDSLYFIRKTASNKNRPDSLVKLDGLLNPMLTKMYNKRMIKKYIQAQAFHMVEKLEISNEYCSLIEKIQHKYPALNWFSYKQEETYKYDVQQISSLCAQYGINLNLQRKIDRAISRIRSKVRNEIYEFKKDYPLYDLFNSRQYWMNDNQIEALKKAVANEIEQSI